jgi:hypothetical protein
MQGIGNARQIGFAAGAHFIGCHELDAMNHHVAETKAMIECQAKNKGPMRHQKAWHKSSGKWWENELGCRRFNNVPILSEQFENLLTATKLTIERIKTNILGVNSGT